MGNLRKFFQSMLSIMISISLCFPTATFTYATEDVSQGESYTNLTEEEIENHEKQLDVLEEDTNLIPEGELLTLENLPLRDSSPINEINSNGLHADITWIPDGLDFEENDSNTVVWSSDSAQSKRFAMRLSYQDRNCEKGYRAGDIEFKIPYLSFVDDSTIGADYDTTNPTKEFYYRFEGDYLVLRNNFDIEPNTNFEGTIEIIWTVNNRTKPTEPNLDKPCEWDFNINLTGTAEDSDGRVTEIQGDNELIFKLYNKHDEFTPSLTASKISSLVGMDENWRDFIWVEYTFSPGQLQYSQGLRDAQYIFEIPSDCVISQNSLGGITTQGKYITKVNNPDQPEIRKFVVGWPADKYEGKTVTLTGYMEGEYLDGTKYLSDVSGTTWTKNLNAADYDFQYEGELFSITKVSGQEEEHYTNKNLTNGSFYFEIDFKGKVMPDLHYTYTILDDYQDIATNSNGYREMDSTEHKISYVYNPIDILDEAGQKRNDADVLTAKVYAIDSSNNETLVGTLTGVGGDEYIKMPDNAINVKVVYENVRGFFDVQGLGVSVDYSITDWDINNSGQPDKIPNSGKFRNVGGILVSDDDGEVVNKAGIENYTGSQAEEIYNRDVEKYGHGIQRAYAEINYHESTDVKADFYQVLTSKINGSAQFNNDHYKQSIGVEWKPKSIWEGDNGGEKIIYKNITFCVLLPKGWEFSSNNNTTISNGCPMEVDIERNYKNTGRALVKFNIDTSNKKDFYSVYNYDNWANLVHYFQIEIPIDLWFEYGKSYEFEAWSFVETDGFGTQIINSNYDVRDTADINGNGNDHEIAGHSKRTFLVDTAIATHLEASERITTEKMGGAWDTNAIVAPGEEYSYKLGFMTAASDAKNVVLYDRIEENSNWQGVIKNIDISYLTDKGYNPIVYVTGNNGVEFNLNDPSWVEYNEYIENCPNGSIAAVAIALDNVMGASSYVMVRLNMIAPQDNTLVGGKAYDNYVVKYTDANGVNNELVSNDVDSILAEDFGSLTILKQDATSGENITGAKFNIYNEAGILIHENIESGEYQLPVGNYYINEEQAPIGYVKDVSSHHFTIEKENNTTETFLNTRKEGVIHIYKNDATNGEPLVGAVFLLVVMVNL